jgi:mono/diheme cytochrome c family protein
LPLKFEKIALSTNALLTTIVALFGILLAKQDSYDNSLIVWHKWGGVAIALISWLLIYIMDLPTKYKKVIGVLFFISIGVFTHKGAQLTHGVNAVSFPQADTVAIVPEVLDSNATVYEKAVGPILAQKCVSCHGNEKVKGGLKLNTIDNVLLGGKSGNILTASAGKDALLFERIHMPLAAEKHMPPDGKQQLTPAEINILSLWIKAGGDIKTKMAQMAKTDSLYLLANAYIPVVEKSKSGKTSYPELTAYNSNYCSVNYLFTGSDEIEVTFFQGSFYNTQALKNLEKIKDQVIHLNMQGMPLTKEDIKIITQFTKLKKLNLNYTKINIEALSEIKKMEQLETLSICGVEVNESSFERFLKDAKFSNINVWSNTISSKQLQVLNTKYPKLKIIIGDNLENEYVKLSSPNIDQDSSIIPKHLDIKIKHLLPGIVIRYTTDGSEPDSLTSPQYKNAFRIASNTTIKTKAFKKGWISSDMVQRTFYKSEIKPDTIYLISKPDPKYQASGANTLADYELGGQNFSNGKWLGYKDVTMEFVAGFKQPKLITEAYFNALVDYGSYIMPIVSITVQGSNDGKIFQKITTSNFALPTKPASMKENKTFSCKFPANSSYRYYKFTVLNIKKLPDWHPGKGTPGWIFIDELFLN